MDNTFLSRVHLKQKTKLPKMGVNKTATVSLCLVLSIASFVSANNLNVYTATVNSPSSFYSYLVAGNTALEDLYSNFNTTGILALGTIFLAASGKIFFTPTIFCSDF